MKRLSLLLLVALTMTLLVFGCSNSSSIANGDTDFPDGDDDVDGVDSVTDGDDVEGDEDQEGDGNSFLLTALGGTFTTANGITLEAPADAVIEDVLVSVEIVDSVVDADKYTTVGDVYKFSPEGTEFLKPLLVKLPYDETKAGSSSLAFFWTVLNDSTSFEAIAGASFDLGIGQASVDHFSYGFVGITPPTMTFDDGETFDVTYAADSSDDAGMQVDISLSSTLLAEGTPVVLTVGSTDLDPVNVGADGKLTFSDVTLLPGANNLSAFADQVDGLDVTISAVVTLGGCRLIFKTPLAAASLSDAGGDCSTTCGDDLDCNKPNLQYDIVVLVENVGGGLDANLSVDSGAAIQSAVGVNEVTFAAVDLPNNASLALDVSATNADSEQCSASIAVAVESTCDCHLVVDPIPTNYNLQDEDQDLVAAGFQRKFKVTSDNCLNGSDVTFNLDGTESVVVLADQEAEVTLTLIDGEHALNVAIEEVGTDRAGALVAPYSFKVDLIAPVIAGTLPADQAILNKLLDLDNDLSNGIQINISGTTTGMETLDPPLEVSLTVNGTAHTSNTLVTANAFSFTSVTLPDLQTASPQSFTLVFSTTDELGNPATKTVAYQAYFSEPLLSFTHIGAKVVGTDENLDLGMIALNVSDDTNLSDDLLQTTVTAASSIVAEGTTAYLSVNSAAPIEALVQADGTILWTLLALDYGESDLAISVDAIGGGTLDATKNVWADWQVPALAITDPLDGDAIDDSTIDITVHSVAANSKDAAEEGQSVQLKINGSIYGSTVDLDASGTAVFANVDIAAKTTAYTLQASVVDKSGNAGSSEIVNVTLDTEAPVVTVTVPDATGDPATIDHNADIQVDITVTDDDATEGRNVTLNLYQGASLQNTHVVQLASGAASYTYPLIADGNFKVEAVYSDKAGNESSDNFEFVVDTGCYNFAITSPAPIFYTNGATVDVTVENSTGAGTIPVPDGTFMEMYIGGSMISSGVMQGGSHTFVDVDLDAGLNEIQVFAYKIQPVFVLCPASPGTINVTRDETNPVITLSTPAFTNPLKINLASTGTAVQDGFEAELTFDVVEDVPDATLDLKAMNGAVTLYTGQASAAKGSYTFNDVLVQSLDAPEGATIAITATMTDLAGNTGTLNFDLLVDRTAPTFSFLPVSGTVLNSSDDKGVEAGFQPEIIAVVNGGTDGLPVTLAVDPIAGHDDMGPYNLAYNAVFTRSEVAMTDTFIEGGYTFNVSHTDDFGNVGSDSSYYDIDFFAALELRNSAFALIEDQTLTWNKASNEDSSTDKGFQATFVVNTYGLEEDPYNVWLCSDKGLEDGNTLAAECASRTCAKSGYSVVACGTLELFVGEDGSVTFTNIPLENGVTHQIYAEGIDQALNAPTSGTATIWMDSEAATLDSFAVTSNDPSNDAAISPNLLLIPELDEGVVDSTNFKIDLSVASAATDVETVNIYVDNDPTGGGQVADISAAVTTGVATFSTANLNPLVVGNGVHALYATTVDTIENESAPRIITVYVDTYAPIPSFADGANISLVSADCNGNDVNDNCLATVNVTITPDVSDAFPVSGGDVTLSYGAKFSASKTIPIFSGASVVVSFTDFPIPQGVTTLTAIASDIYGNVSSSTKIANSNGNVTAEYTVDSISPEAAITTPASDGSYSDADNDDTTCGDGGGLADLKLRRCDWEISVTGVEEPTDYWVEWKIGETAWQAFDPAITATLTPNKQDFTNISIKPLDFYRGDFDVRVRLAEQTTGNTSISATRTMTVNFDPGFYVYLEKTGTDTQMLDGTTFKATEKQSGSAAGKFNVDLLVRTNAPIGTVPVIKLGGSSGTVTGTGAAVAACGSGDDNCVLFEDVVLDEAPTETTLYVEVIIPVDGTFSSTVNNIVADSQAPVLTFTNPVPAVDPIYYGYDKDNDGDNTNGLVEPAGAYQIKVYSENIEVGQQATLKAYDGVTKASVALSGTLTADFIVDGVGFSATFTGAILPLTNGLTNGWLELDVETSDAVGNPNADIASKPKLVVDDDSPENVANLTACIGGDTGSTDAFDMEDAACANTYACAEDTSAACNDGEIEVDSTCIKRCDRNGGSVTLFFDAADNDKNHTGSIAASSYDVQWTKATDTVDPCSGVSWNASWAAPSGEAVTFDANAALNTTQAAVVTGLSINTNTSYCFLVRASDAAGNTSVSAVSIAREVKYLVTTLDTLPASDNLGYRIVWADFNGDNKGDFALSDLFGNGFTGAAWIYYGQDPVPTTPPTSDQQIYGAALDLLGDNMVAGDLNGDDKDDLVLGARYSNSGDGKVYIHFGKDATSVGDASDLPNVTISGLTGQSFGQGLALLDWDGDALGHDLFIGTKNDDAREAPVYFFYGRSAADWGTDLTGTVTTDADFIVNREVDSIETATLFGWDLGNGNFDGTGNEDLLIADIDHDDADLTTDDMDRFWVMWADSTLSGTVVADSTDGFDVISNPDSPYVPGDQFGTSVYGLPDTNNDGKDEVMILKGGTDSAHYYKDITDISAQPNGVIFTYATDTIYPKRPYTAGDFNHDGYNDVVMAGTGVVRIHWGSANGISPSSFTDLAGMVVSQFAAAGGGDYNNDGSPDLVVIDRTTGDVLLIH